MPNPYQTGLMPVSVPEAARGRGYGLSAGLDTLGRGATMGLDTLGETSRGVSRLFDDAGQQITPYIEPGQMANQRQAALSGAMGPAAQQQAFTEFQASPGQQFLQQQGERALTRNAAATGGLSGGNVLRELVKYGQGLAMQDLDAQFGRMGDVATRGLQAGTTYGGLRGQEAGIQSGLGQMAAQIPFQSGQIAGGQQIQAGRDISGVVGNTTSSLANLINQQGAGTTDILAQGYGGINDLIQRAYSGDAAAKEQLATTLANLSVQGSSQYSSQPYIPGYQSNYLGQIGQLAGGIGGMMQGMNYGQSPAYTNPGNQQFGNWYAQNYGIPGIPGTP